MATYVILNTIFLLVVIIGFGIKPKVPSKFLLYVLVALLLLTAIFDSLIIGFGIVAYNQLQILGIYIGKAPIEDFFYALLAVILVPTIWSKITNYDRKS